MQTLQPTLRNGRNVWDRIHMPIQLFHNRVDAVRKEMASCDIDIVIAYGRAFNHYANPCYLSGYMIRLPKGFMVAVTPEDVVLFYEGASRGLSNAKKLTWIEDVRPCSDIVKSFTEFLLDKSSVKPHIGLAGVDMLMPYEQRYRLNQALNGSAFSDFDPFFRNIRKIKSERELDQIKRAGRIVVHALQKIEQRPFPGFQERIIEATIIREARLEGAEDVRVLFGRPQVPGWQLASAGNDAVNSGETLIVYLALVFERYWAEAACTFIVDKNVLARPDIEVSQQLFKEMKTCIQPGKAVKECNSDMQAVLSEHSAGFIDHYGFGQGIGLDPEEWPSWDEEGSGYLENGMCMTLHACMKDPGIGEIMIGETVAVTASGIDVIT